MKIILEGLEELDFTKMLLSDGITNIFIKNRNNKIIQAFYKQYDTNFSNIHNFSEYWNICIDPKTKDVYIEEKGKKLFSTRITRLADRLMKFRNEEYTQKDMEDFINRFNNSNSPINYTTKLLKGNEISKCYKNKNIYPTGTLGNSCMNDKPQMYFEIYDENPERISLLTFYDYTNTLIARCLLWKLDDNTLYRDRIYGSENILINQLQHTFEFNIDNEIIKIDKYFSNNTKKLEVTLKKIYFPVYPYLDTFRYLFLDGKNKLTNINNNKYYNGNIFPTNISNNPESYIHLQLTDGDYTKNYYPNEGGYYSCYIIILELTSIYGPDLNIKIIDDITVSFNNHKYQYISYLKYNDDDNIELKNKIKNKIHKNDGYILILK